MKQLTFIMLLIGIGLLSCNRQNPSNSLPITLQGNWRMITVKDNNSGAVTVRPNNILGNVDLAFTTVTDSSGTFQGHTPANDIYQSKYLIGTNQQMTIPFLDMTKVGENAWGSAFVDNIPSTKRYGFDTEHNLVIVTTNKTFTFQRQ